MRRQIAGWVDRSDATSGAEETKRLGLQNGVGSRVRGLGCASIDPSCARRGRGALIATIMGVASALGAGAAAAGDREDCDGDQHAKAIPACTRLIGSGKLEGRALATTYYNRGVSLAANGDSGGAIDDYSTAIAIDPRYAKAYFSRGNRYRAKGDCDQAIADYSKAIEIDSRDAAAYYGRGACYYIKDHYDRAIADLDIAIEIKPQNPSALVVRGNSHFQKNNYDLAISNCSKAIEIDESFALAYSSRAIIYKYLGRHEEAVADYSRALVVAQDRSDADSNQARRLAQEGLAKLKAPRDVASSEGRRLALVIANSAYSDFTRLTNPPKDAKAVAAAFRNLGFAEVIEHADLSRSALVEALKSFGDKAAGADWAVVYYAGHGVQVAGTNYLVPVDARLLKERHVEDEAVSLDRVLANVRDARKLRLVVLDACRNNPFLARMETGDGKRAGQSRGLTRVEPQGGVLVAFAARDGQVADDGEAENSPFAAAFLDAIRQPGLEIGKVFRKVRAAVMDKTKGEQEPVIYGALPDEDLYFKAVEAR